ncbi:hypothetical protein RB195_014012 [Necator americanus]|uniref:Uncharacterized protein n=1 Tax=Necator americanus TaxID=51031 RepID=A0ABR1DZT6_NECAM
MGDYGEGGDSVHFFLIAVKNGPEDTASFVLAYHFVQESPITYTNTPPEICTTSDSWGDAFNVATSHQEEKEGSSLFTQTIIYPLKFNTFWSS